jgi:NADPH:quinone reductase-like Zn-dependent oxidoreductase
MSRTTRAVVVEAPGRLSLASVALAAAMPGDVTIEVHALSLNRGEVKRALTMSDAGARPGWDIAGVVIEAAADGSGPAIGRRVVGVLPTGAWSRHVRIPSHSVGVLPDAVTYAQAATLPVAGLTALLALRKGGLLLGHKVLVDGASGGVGHLGVQLAAGAGATVYGHVRKPEQVPLIERYCKGGVVVGPTLEAAAAASPYHLILDSLGGSALAAALGMLKNGGACVTFGASESQHTPFDSARFFRTAGVTLHGLMMFDEIRRGESASDGLELLAGLVADGRLVPHISVEDDWSAIGTVAPRLLARAFPGKAVLHLKD